MGERGLDFTGVVLITVIVVLVAGVLTGNISLVHLSPNYGIGVSQGQTFVNAHKCTKDSTCETTNLRIESLGGDGFGYACLDGNGDVVRSDVPCDDISVVCFDDGDCSDEIVYQCEGNSSCSTERVFNCLNPGTPQSTCVFDHEEFLGCVECEMGFMCAEGQCIPEGISYTITEIDVGIEPGSGDSVYVRDINNLGQVSGWVNFYGVPSSDIFPFIWQDGVVTYLDLLPEDTDGISGGVNDNGVVIGWSGNATGFEQGMQEPVRWVDGIPESLGSLGATGYPHSTGINERGDIVGESGSTGFFWDVDTSVMEALPTLGSNILPFDINNDRVIAGRATVGANRHAVRWVDFVIEDLGTLGGNHASANGINEEGYISGYADTPISFGTIGHAFRWNPITEEMEDLGVLGGGLFAESAASNINSVSEITGQSDVKGDTNKHAFIWKDGEMRVLNDLIPSGTGWLLTESNDVNDNGLIVGKGRFGGSSERLYLLTPI